MRERDLYVRFASVNTQTQNIMNEVIKAQLIEKRNIVEERFNEMVENHEKVNTLTRSYTPMITSKKFFFQVVSDHFENMSKVMVNKCLKSENRFYQELYKAIDKAKYACAKPGRDYYSKKMKSLLY